MRPIAVPVVRPSNTPERIFTRSGSWRWLVNCDVPVRLGSRSAWMSASNRPRPGGHPSTIAPIAGPWLSPKVVTQKERPIVLPDIVESLARQIRGAQQEYFREPVLELEPYQRQAAKPAPHAARGIADFDHEDTVPREVAPGAGHDALDDGKPVARGAQRRRGLGAVLARQAAHLTGRDVRGIAHDDIVAPPPEAVIHIGGHHAHATPEPVALHVVAGDRPGAGRDVGGVDMGVRQRMRGCNRDAPGTRTDVEHAADAHRVDPRREAGAAQFGDG